MGRLRLAILLRLVASFESFESLAEAAQCLARALLGGEPNDTGTDGDRCSLAVGHLHKKGHVI